MVVLHESFTPPAAGDRLTAYVAYDTAIKLLSSGQFKAVDEDYREGRAAMAVLFGNKAVVCTGVSHGSVIQAIFHPHQLVHST